MSIQRWDVVNYQDLFPSEDGEFCDYAEYEKLQQELEALTKRLQRARLDTVEFIHDEIIDGSETANEARRDVFNYYLKLQLEGKSKQEPASD